MKKSGALDMPTGNTGEPEKKITLDDYYQMTYENSKEDGETRKAFTERMRVSLERILKETPEIVSGAGYNVQLTKGKLK
jgi:hypothetical protein